MAYSKWSEVDDQHLRELHASGLSINAISKKMGRGLGTVSRHAKMLNLPPRHDEQTKVATEYRMQDAKVSAAERLERNNALADCLLDQAFELNTMLRSSKIATWIPTQGGGRELKYVPLHELPVEDREAINRIMVKNYETIAKVENLNPRASVAEEEAKSLLASTAELLMRSEKHPEILEANREPRPEEVGADE